MYDLNWLYVFAVRRIGLTILETNDKSHCNLPESGIEKKTLKLKWKDSNKKFQQGPAFKPWKIDW